jgi:hypothetical protein
MFSGLFRVYGMAWVRARHTLAAAMPRLHRSRTRWRPHQRADWRAMRTCNDRSTSRGCAGESIPGARAAVRRGLRAQRTGSSM